MASIPCRMADWASSVSVWGEASTLVRLEWSGESNLTRCFSGNLSLNSPSFLGPPAPLPRPRAGPRAGWGNWDGWASEGIGVAADEPGKGEAVVKASEGSRSGSSMDLRRRGPPALLPLVADVGETEAWVVLEDEPDGGGRVGLVSDLRCGECSAEAVGVVSVDAGCWGGGTVVDDLLVDGLERCFCSLAWFWNDESDAAAGE